MVLESFRDLRVWQGGMELVEEIYRFTTQFPADEKFGLVSQMRRAAVSIPSNIAEGYVRESTQEYLRHLSIAQASLAELQTQLEIAERLGFLPNEEVTRVLQASTSLAKQLYALRNAILRKNNATIPSPQSSQ